MKEKEIKFRLVPPQIHRRNLAERAIRNFKEQFIVGLASINHIFPIYLWYRWLKQATLTLNMTRNSRIPPNLSAYNKIHGTYNFTKTPLIPLGIKVLVHEKASVRKYWATNRIYMVIFETIYGALWMIPMVHYPNKILKSG